MDIKNTAIAATAKVHLRDAAGELLYEDNGDKVTITVYGPGSKEYQRAKHLTEERNSERTMARMQRQFDSKLSAEDKRTERAEFLADCSATSENLTHNGQPVTSREQFKAMYEDIEIGHVADEVDTFLASRANFKKPSTKK